MKAEKEVAMIYQTNEPVKPLDQKLLRLISPEVLFFLAIGREFIPILGACILALILTVLF